MVSSIPTFVSLAPYIVSVLLLLLLLEQLSYFVKKRNLPGPLFFPPIIGNIVSLICNPTSLWDKQSTLQRPLPLAFPSTTSSENSLFTSKTLSCPIKIFSNILPDDFHLVGHPFGKKLFGDHSLIYMFGEEHKSVCGHLAPNFTPKALFTYSTLQQLVILHHLRRWEECFSDGSKPVLLRELIRDLNLETSQMVFVGPYPDKEARFRFCFDYKLLNLGTMAVPINLPGFAFGEARRAVIRLVNTLSIWVGKSKAKVAAKEEPTCLIDFWMHSIISENLTPPPHSKDREISCLLVDFLFALQDASTSSLLWAVVLLELEPEVLRRVREEVARIWLPESNALITADQLAEMKCPRSVAREVVRYRPPASMVPHIASSDFTLMESYTIPKGAIVFPSVFDSSFQGFTEPDRFDPDQFSETRQEDQVFKRNFLVYGSGSHQCVGQRYTMNHLFLFIVMFSLLLDFKRLTSDGCDEIVYCPMTSPKDGCNVLLSKGSQTLLSFL